MTRIFQVDAFAERAFGGNPAAVCLLDEGRGDEWMQLVAREMNLSETAFLRADGEAFALRWFTPTVEVELCGHATLASAHVLWEAGVVPKQREIVFGTMSGRLSARRGDSDLITMDFPATTESPVEVPEGLVEAVGIEPLYVGRSRHDLLVMVAEEDEVRGLRPDLDAIGALPARGVIVTAQSRGTKYDFVSRFFAPAVGVPEDPVTGSAHCCLGPFWKTHTGRSSFTAFQASARGGIVHVTVSDGRVELGGRAVTVLEGALRV